MTRESGSFARGRSMQKLHVVGFTTEMDGLVLSARKGSKSGGYTVAVEAIVTFLEGAERLPAPGGSASAESAPRLSDLGSGIGRRSALSPREIQARLRAGRSLREVAREASVDEAWVSRFAAPVLAEQAKVVDRARSITFVKPRRGPSAQPLGTAVRWGVADRGVRLAPDEFDQGWSAAQLHDQVWVVGFGFVSRRRAQRAEWQLDLRDPHLVALNRLASTLGFVDPNRRTGPPEEQLSVEPAPAPAPARKRAPRAARAAPRAKVAAAPVAPRRAVPVARGGARKAMPPRPGAPSPAARSRAAAPASPRATPSPAARSRAAAPASPRATPSTAGTRAAAAEALAAKFSGTPVVVPAVSALKVPAWKAPGSTGPPGGAAPPARSRKPAGRATGSSRKVPAPGRAEARPVTARGPAARRSATTGKAAVAAGRAAKAGTPAGRSRATKAAKATAKASTEARGAGASRRAAPRAAGRATTPAGRSRATPKAAAKATAKASTPAERRDATLRSVLAKATGKATGKAAKAGATTARRPATAGRWKAAAPAPAGRAARAGRSTTPAPAERATTKKAAPAKAAGRATGPKAPAATLPPPAKAPPGGKGRSA